MGVHVLPCATTTLIETLITASEQVEAVPPQSKGIQEVVADKGYHSTERITDMSRAGLRTYVSEPKHTESAMAR